MLVLGWWKVGGSLYTDLDARARAVLNVDDLADGALADGLGDRLDVDVGVLRDVAVRDLQAEVDQADGQVDVDQGVVRLRVRDANAEEAGGPAPARFLLERLGIAAPAAAVAIPVAVTIAAPAAAERGLKGIERRRWRGGRDRGNRGNRGVRAPAPVAALAAGTVDVPRGGLARGLGGVEGVQELGAVFSRDLLFFDHFQDTQLFFAHRISPKRLKV